MVQKKRLAQELGLVLPKDISDQVLNTLNTSMDKGNFSVPENYHLGNALKAAYTMIANDRNLMNTDPISKANSLVQMAVLGLSPAKKQAYFIPFDGKCTLMTSYFGKVTAIKRIKGIKDVRCDVIYKETEYVLSVDDWGNDTIEITKSAPLEVRGNREHMIGAWAKLILDPEVWGTDSFTVLMNMEQIQKAWNLGKGNGKTKAHIDFPDEMAKKTVINRVIKMFVNTSDDSDLISGALNDLAVNENKEPDYKPQGVNEETTKEQVIEFEEIKEEPKQEEVVIEKVAEIKEEETPKVDNTEYQEEINIDLGELDF